MKKMKLIILSLLSLSFCILQHDLQYYFDQAINRYPQLKRISWVINESNSLNIEDKHLQIEAISKTPDTTYFVTFDIFLNDSSSFINLLEFAEITSDVDFEYYTGFDSNLKQVFSYKYPKNNPDSIIFISGEEYYRYKGLR